jgi:hypothetical protein
LNATFNLLPSSRRSPSTPSLNQKPHEGRRLRPAQLKRAVEFYEEKALDALGRSIRSLLLSLVEAHGADGRDLLLYQSRGMSR